MRANAVINELQPCLPSYIIDDTGGKGVRPSLCLAEQKRDGTSLAGASSRQSMAASLEMGMSGISTIQIGKEKAWLFPDEGYGSGSPVGIMEHLSV